MQREEWVGQIQRTRGELEALLARFSQQEQEQVLLTNGWSIKDLLAHLTFWQARVVAIYGHLLGGPAPEPAPGSLTTDELNAQVYTANHDLSLADVSAREQASHQAVLDLIDAAPEEDLIDRKRFAWTKGRPFTDWIEGNTAGHYQEHMPDLRGLLGLPGSVAYKVSDHVLRGYAAHPTQSGRPGVIVLHAWWGLTPFFQRLCDRLAEAGFVAFAPDLNDGKIAKTIEEASALMAERDFGLMNTTALSAVEQIRHQVGVGAGPLGVIGFSMGAAWALVLSSARPADIGAVTLFYGTEHLDFSPAQAAYLGHFAAQDQWEPDESVRQLMDELKTAGREVNFYAYPGTGHWFFEDDRPEAFHPQAAAVAWDRTLAFLRAKLS